MCKNCYSEAYEMSLLQGGYPDDRENREECWRCHVLALWELMRPRRRVRSRRPFTRAEVAAISHEQKYGGHVAE